MQSINVLGLKAAGTTLVGLLLLYGIWWGANALYRSLIGPPPQEEKSAEETVGENQDAISASLEQDSDNDELPDLVEELYRSDPNNPDSDADGTPDGQEISSGRNPTVPGPDDVSKPPTGANVPNEDTYTFKYLSTLPENAPREDVLNKEKIEAFVEEHRAELLTTVEPASIKTTSATGKEAIATYLDGISATHNKELKPVTNTDIEEAHKMNYAQQKPETIDNIIKALENNVTVLKDIQPPKETVELHAKLVSASQSLYDNTKALKNIANDFIGSLIAAKNIEELGKTFQDIAKSVEELEKKYGIK